MKTKLIVALAVFAIAALFPLSSLSKGESAKQDRVVVSSNNTLVLNGEVTGESVGELIAKAKQLDTGLSGLKEKVSSKRPLYLFIYSPGGSIQAGLELIEALRGLDRPVHTITLFSASMAFQIAQNMDDRLILRNGALMSHHAAGEFGGDFGGADTQAMSRFKFWLQRVKELDEQTVKRTNGKQTYESYTKQYDHEMWLTGQQSVDQGYADRVVAFKCDSSLSGVTSKQIVFMGINVSYDIDNCPINTTPMNIKFTAPDGKVIVGNQADETRIKFLTQYEQKARQVIPMYW
jgi:ATP-dependent protease ClpP protease subunit